MTSERYVEPTGTEPHGETYRIEHPTLRVVLADLRVPSTDPGPGDIVPPFDLPTTEGGRIDNEELRRGERPVLLVFGSLTCPVTESAGDGLRELHSRYGERIRFVLVNVREAHPGEATPQPASFTEKFDHAVALREHHRLPFEVAVDDIEGTLHRQFGPRPSSAYVIAPSGEILFRAQWSNVTDAIDEALGAIVSGATPLRPEVAVDDIDGTLHRQFGPRPSSAYVIAPSGEILFRAQWSNVTDAIDEALGAIVSGATPLRPEVAHTVRAMAAMTGHADTAFAAAGRGAWFDTWRAAPPFAAMIGVSRLFGFLHPSRRGLPAMATMAAIVAGVVMAVVALLV